MDKRSDAITIEFDSSHLSLVSTAKTGGANSLDETHPLGRIARTSGYRGHALACLVAADRYHQQDHDPAPLAAGRVVVCDRYVPSSYVLQPTDGVQIEFIEALNADVDQPDLAVILTADSVVTLDRITARGTRHRFETGLTSSTQEAELYADTAARLTARRDAYRREPRRRVARRRELVGANLDHVVLDHANLNYAHLASVKHDQFTDIAEAVTTGGWWRPARTAPSVLSRRFIDSLLECGMGDGRGPKLALLELTQPERDTLQGWARRGKTAQALAARARIVLACAQGLSNSEVSRELKLSLPTVGKWRKRFVEDRLDGLSDEPRPGAPRKITDGQVEEVITKTLEEQPANRDSHWSTRSMAAATGMSQTAISRIWRAFGLKPHLVDTWKLSTDPLFIDKVRDVVGLYLDPPDKAMVLAVDEKSQMQALDRTAPMLPMMPGTPERRTHDYVRYGTTSLFAALDITTGQVIGQHQRRHRHQEFLRFLKTIDKNTPAELNLHLVCDNYATHKTPAIKTWLAGHPRFHLHFTPTSSSWLNLVERWFAELTNRKLRRSAHRSVKALEDDVEDWIAAWNEDPKPFVWTKTADEILDSLVRYCTQINKTINDSGH